MEEFIRYANSKLCNVFFTSWLAKKYEGSNKTAYACHPGVVRTNIFENSKPKTCCGKFFFYFLVPIWYPLWMLISRPVWWGAQTQLYLCLAPKDELKSGEYYDRCRPQKVVKKEGYDEHEVKIMKLSEEYVKDFK